MNGLLKILSVRQPSVSIYQLSAANFVFMVSRATILQFMQGILTSHFGAHSTGLLWSWHFTAKLFPRTLLFKASCRRRRSIALYLTINVVWKPSVTKLLARSSQLGIVLCGDWWLCCKRAVLRWGLSSTEFWRSRPKPDRNVRGSWQQTFKQIHSESLTNDTCFAI